MSRLLVLLAAVALFAVCEGRFLNFAANGDPLAVVREILYTANQDITRQNKSVVYLEDFDFRYMAQVSAKGAKVGILNTIALVGDRQSLTQVDNPDNSVLNFDLTLGLEQLIATAHYTFRVPFLFRSSGTITINVQRDAIRARGSLTSDNNNHCTLAMDSVEIDNLGDFDVEVTPSSISNWIFKHTLQFNLNHIVPLFKGTINNHINQVVKEQLPVLQEQACKPFVI